MLPAANSSAVQGRYLRSTPGLNIEFIVDDMAHRLVVRPQDIDVLLLPNLYGDILSDLGAGTIGGLGLAPSGCYGYEFAYFESAHGTAPDLAGKGTINLTAILLSCDELPFTSQRRC